MTPILKLILFFRKIIAYKILRKLITRFTKNLNMKKRISFVKHINSQLYKPWVKMRKNIHINDLYKMKSVKFNDGFLIENTLKFPFVKEAIQDGLKIASLPVDNIKKSYLINHLDTKDLSNYEGLLKFCTSPLLVGTVAKYLDEFPVISSIEVWNSPPREVHGAGLTGSQKFHLDNVSNKQMKVFVNLINISDENGPFSFISESHSRKVCNSISYGNVVNVERVEDEDVYNIVNSNELKKNVGDAGLVTLIDTCRCLHYGSRNTSKGRKLLMIQYTSVARADSRPFEPFPRDIYKNSEFINLLFDPFHYLFETKFN